MPKKKPEFADEQEGKMEEVWDVRKIIIGVVFLIVLIIAGLVGKRILFHESLSPSSFIPHLPSVRGISTFNAPQDQVSHVKISLPSQKDVQAQIQTIQQQVTHLNVQEVASSSPQVQAIIKQLQELPSGPVGQVKDACIRLCNNL